MNEEPEADSRVHCCEGQNQYLSPALMTLEPALLIFMIHSFLIAGYILIVTCYLWKEEMFGMALTNAYIYWEVYPRRKEKTSCVNGI